MLKNISAVEPYKKTVSSVILSKNKKRGRNMKKNDQTNKSKNLILDELFEVFGNESGFRAAINDITKKKPNLAPQVIYNWKNGRDISPQFCPIILWALQKRGIDNWCLSKIRPDLYGTLDEDKYEYDKAKRKRAKSK